MEGFSNSDSIRIPIVKYDSIQRENTEMKMKIRELYRECLKVRAKAIEEDKRFYDDIDLDKIADIFDFALPTTKKSCLEVVKNANLFNIERTEEP